MSSPTTFSLIVLVTACLALISGRVEADTSDDIRHLFNEMHHSLSVLRTDYLNPAHNRFRDDDDASGALGECESYSDIAAYDAEQASQVFQDESSRKQSLVYLAACVEYLSRCENDLTNSIKGANEGNVGDAFDDILSFIKGPEDTIQRAFDMVCNMTRGA